MLTAIEVSQVMMTFTLERDSSVSVPRSLSLASRTSRDGGFRNTNLVNNISH